MIYAGFWKRLAAALIDAIIFKLAWMLMMITIGLALIASFGIDHDINNNMEQIEAHPTFMIGSTLLQVVLYWLYFAIMESSGTQGTFGKMLLKIKVTDLEGQRIGFGRATGRYFSKIISAVLLLGGYIMIAFTARKQGLHDMMAGCLVAKK